MRGLIDTIQGWSRARKAALAAAVLYVAGLQAFVLISLFTPQVIDDQRWRWHALQRSPLTLSQDLTPYYAAQDAQAGPGRVVMIGASHCHRFDAAAMKVAAMTYCAGGMTMAYAADTFASFDSVRHAQTLILWAGVNDLLRGAEPSVVVSAARTLIDATEGSVIIVAIPPTAASRGQALSISIGEANEGLKRLCQTNCKLIDTPALLSGDDGHLLPLNDIGDGLHLSPAGYRVMAGAIAEALGGRP